MRERWEADERPEPRSLGLLPSGPDPVGEWLVHRQPPRPYIGRAERESKLAQFRLARRFDSLGQAYDPSAEDHDFVRKVGRAWCPCDLSNDFFCSPGGSLGGSPGGHHGASSVRLG